MIRRLLPHSVLLVAALVVSLLALEGAARLYAKLTHQERGMTFDPELGWRPLAHVKKLGGVWGVTRPASTNSHGWRDSERTYEKPAGIRRAVAIGDSFTFGVEVDDGDRFSDVLPRLVDRLEVINLGVAGYGTDQELRVLETEAFRYDPDVVILTLCVFNDLDDIGSDLLYSWPKPAYRLLDGRLQLRRPRLTWDIRARTSSYLVESLLQRLSDQDNRSRPAEGFSPSDAQPLFDALVRQMAAVTAGRRIPVVALLAYAPDEIDPDSASVARIMTGALDRAGIPSVDVRALFAGRSPNPLRTFFDPGGHHWNAKGHEVVAAGLRDLLARAGVQ